MQKRAWILASAIVFAYAVLRPFPAAAQRLTAIIPVSGAVEMNATATHAVAYTFAQHVAADTDGQQDVYLFTVSGLTWQLLPRKVLARVPEAADSSQFEFLGLSDDGRYLGYVARSSDPAGRPLPPILARYDIVTGLRDVVRDAGADPFDQPVMSRDGQTFAWIGANQALLVARVAQTATVIAVPCARIDNYCPASPALSADGQKVLYYSLDEQDRIATLEVFDRATNGRVRHEALAAAGGGQLLTSATGRHVFLSNGPAGLVADLDTGLHEQVPIGFSTRISDDGRYVLTPAGVYDRRSSMVLLPGGDVSHRLSADGRLVLVRAGNLYLLLDLDGDDDGMADPWETVFGLSSTDGADGARDDDGDGISNREEFHVGSHPRGTYRRAFAEGVRGSGFETAVHVMTSIRASDAQFPRTPLVVSFFGDDGSRGSRTMSGAVYPTDGGVATVPGLVTSSSFTMLVESQAPFAAARRTTWGSPIVRGMHGSAGAVPATRWYFAEGATTGGFQLFYLLGNQGINPATVTIEYLLASGQQVSRQHVVPGGSRYTVWVNAEGGPLRSAEVAARITSSVPIVAERAMYLGDAAGGLGAGASSAGVPAPGPTWLFAEGATSGLFDTFITLLNPGGTPAVVDATYRLPDGTPIQRTHTVAAGSRHTIWVNHEDPALAAATFSTRLEADGDIVAERAMWWRPAPGAPWIEGHAEIGATSTAPVWLAPNVGESDFVLIANHSDVPARVRVTLYTHAGGGAGSAVYDIPAGSRATCWPVQDMGNRSLPPGRYEAIVESLASGGTSTAGLVVEVAAYATERGAGTVSLATPLPAAGEPRR